MRNPGFVAVYLVDVALAHRPRLQRRQIRTDIRLCEYRGGEYFAGGDLRKPFAFLLLGAGAGNEFGGDLRARPEAADPDITPRQFLGNDAHRFLAQPHALVTLGDGQAEHAELRHLRDRIERYVFVAQMPGLRERRHALVGELAHFFADRIQRLIEPAVADRRVLALAHQFDQPRPARRRIPGGNEMLDGRIEPRRNRRRVQSKVGQAHDLALAHGNAAEHLRQIFAGANSHQQFLDFAEYAAVGKPLRVLGELANGLDIGRKPGEPVGRALLAVESARHQAAVDCHALAYRAAGITEQRV